MKSNELKENLLKAANILQDSLKEDLLSISVTKDWSNIDDASEHVQFLLEQTLGVAHNLEDKPTVSTDSLENVEETS